MRELPILDRIRARAARLMQATRDRKKMKQVQVADGVGLSSSHISNFLKGKYELRLRHLDRLADALGVPPSELVRRTDEPLYELSDAEARLIGYYRQWTPDAQHALLSVLDFVHAKLPDDPQTVRMFAYWRKLGFHERAILYGEAVRLNDEALPPDVRAALGIPPTDEGKSGRGGKRRPRDGTTP